MIELLGWAVAGGLLVLLLGAIWLLYVAANTAPPMR